MKNKFKTILKISPFSLYENYRDRKIKKEKKKKQQKIISNYLKNNKTKRLQIGCGTNILQGWLNTDLNEKEAVAFLDAREKFPFKNTVFDFIYSEHLFEHLTVAQQINMLKEGKRCLKSGGIMRIATPSLDFLFDLYANNNIEKNQRYTDWAIKSIPYLNIVKQSVKDKSAHYNYVINNFFKAWGHQMIHNFDSLQKLAVQIGYSAVREVKVGESEVPDLKNIENHGTIIPEKFNLMETMVVEIIK